MDILQVRELKQSLERRDARILELERQLEAARQPQERGEAVAPIAVLRRQIGEDTWFDHAPVKPGSKAHLNLQESAEMDYCEVYAHPPADDARVVELERDLRIERKRAEHAEKVATVNYADLRQATAHIAALEAQLTASREREGRMREALLRAQAWGGLGKGWESSVALDLIAWIDDGMDGPLPDLPYYLNKAALAAEKE